MFTSSFDPAAEGRGIRARGGGAAAAGSGAGSGGVAFDERSPHMTALKTIVDRLEAVEQRIREAEAERTALMAEAFDLAVCESDRIASTPQGRRAELAHRAVRAELAACLHQSEQVTERQLSHAFTLTRNYRAVFQAYRSGGISRQHTTVIMDAGAIIGSGDAAPDAPEVVARRAGYEEAVLAYALRETPSRLRPIARRLAEQYAQRSLDERHAQAKSRRRVCVVDAEDGMADLYAHLPAVEAYAIHDRLTRIAKQAALGEGPGEATEPRTRDEIRADAFAELLLSASVPSVAGAETETGSEAGVGSHAAAHPVSRIRGQVQVVLAEQHLFEVDRDHRDTPPEDELFALGSPPPMLEGYGPVDTGSARRVAGEATGWELIREDVRSGAILSVDRYRPSERMRRLLGARDRHCRFPGCRVKLSRCDIDHTVDAAKGGRTATDNLAHLCRGHHTLKHHSGWRVEQLPGGVLRWSSPTGRSYADRPERSNRPPSRVCFSPPGVVPAGSPPGVDPAGVRSDADPADAPPGVDPGGSLPPPGAPF